MVLPMGLQASGASRQNTLHAEEEMQLLKSSLCFLTYFSWDNFVRLSNKLSKGIWVTTTLNWNPILLCWPQLVDIPSEQACTVLSCLLFLQPKPWMYNHISFWKWLVFLHYRNRIDFPTECYTCRSSHNQISVKCPYASNSHN